MDKFDKAYNYHLIMLWVNNNYNNYMQSVKLDKSILKDDEKLLAWLKSLEYGGDKEKIKLDAESVYIDAIRSDIIENQVEFKSWD